MKKYQYLASWDDQTLTRVGEPVVVLGDSNVSQVEVILPSNFLLDPTKVECRMYFMLPGEKESAHDVLETAVKDENGDSHVTWTIKHVHSQKGGRLAFSLTLIGDDAQWDSRTAIIPVYESRYQPESEEAEKPYTGRLDALEGSMAAIRGEFAEVQDDFEELKETATLGTPIPESLVANMTEGHIYVYTGTETGYTAGHVYYYVNGVLKDGGVYGGTAVDATLTESGKAADAAAVGAEVSAIKEDLSALEKAVYTEKTVDPTTGERIKGLIANSTGNWATTGSWYSYILPVPFGSVSVNLVSNVVNGSVFALLASRELTVDTPPIYATDCIREWIQPGETKTLAVPDDAKYILLIHGNTVSGAFVSYTPQSLTFTVDSRSNISTITHEPIFSEGVLAVVRRCRQLTDIKWTPAVDIPRICQLRGYSSTNSQYYEDVFKAGVEYKGVPYGQATKNARSWGKPTTTAFKVGLGVGLDTFISAVQSPESVVAKDSVYTCSGSTHLASFYSTICSALCCYAYDFPVYYKTDQVDDADGMIKLGLVSSVGIDNLKIGDMLHTNAHAIVITDLIRDENEKVSAIEISEATTIGNDNWNIQGSQYGGICRREFVNKNDFLVKWGVYTVCRYSYIDNVTYTPSPYVNTGDEPVMRRINNFPVLPYMGENFVYVAGAIANTKILTPAYRADSLNKLRVKKDGADWNTNGTTDYYDVTGACVEVGFTEAGSYEAYLCQVTNGSETMTTRTCHWTVIDT